MKHAPDFLLFLPHVFLCHYPQKNRASLPTIVYTLPCLGREGGASGTTFRLTFRISRDPMPRCDRELREGESHVLLDASDTKRARAEGGGGDS